MFPGLFPHWHTWKLLSAGFLFQSQSWGPTTALEYPVQGMWAWGGAGWWLSRSCPSPGTSSQTQIPQFLFPGHAEGTQTLLRLVGQYGFRMSRSPTGLFCCLGRGKQAAKFGGDTVPCCLWLWPLLLLICVTWVPPDPLVFISEPPPCRGNFWPGGFPVLFPSSFCSPGTWLITGWGTAGQTWQCQPSPDLFF